MTENAQNEIFGKWIDRIYRQLLHINKSKIERFNISPSEYNYFLTIEEFPGCTQKFLAQKRMVDKALVARIVKKYVDKGYIAKVQSQEKKSSYNLFLTQAGESLVKEIREAISATDNLIRQQYGEEANQQLITELKKISGYLEEQGSD